MIPGHSSDACPGAGQPYPEIIVRPVVHCFIDATNLNPIRATKSGGAVNRVALEQHGEGRARGNRPTALSASKQNGVRIGHIAAGPEELFGRVEIVWPDFVVGVQQDDKEAVGLGHTAVAGMADTLVLLVA